MQIFFQVSCFIKEKKSKEKKNKEHKETKQSKKKVTNSICLEKGLIPQCRDDIHV